MTKLQPVISLLVLTAWLPFAAAASNPCPTGDTAWPAGWTAPYPAHRVIGDLYAVGMEDLGVFLITTSEGHILINTGLEGSTSLIRKNVESLGFRLEDVRLLLTTQAHFDHTAALADIQRISGAEMWATEKDARVLADGGASDAHFGECAEMRFAPISVDHVLSDAEVIELGGLQITTHLHPGHTEGSASYSFSHREGGRDYSVLIANMGTINPGKRLLVRPTYPGAAEDFARTYRAQKAMKVDVWVASHGSQYGLTDKHQPGQSYDPDAFVDPAGFMSEVMRLEQIYLQQLEEEQR